MSFLGAAFLNPVALSAGLVRGFRKGGPIQNAAKRGIFCGKEIGFGNKVSHSKRKTRRSWKPNVQHKTYFSEILGESIRLNVTTTAIRCIKKHKGLDNFLINASHLVRDSDTGKALRARVLQEKSAFERAAILHQLGVQDVLEGPWRKQERVKPRNDGLIPHNEIHPLKFLFPRGH
jgi:ribosomal protein L28